MYYTSPYKLGWEDGYYDGIADCPYIYGSYAYWDYWDGFFDGEDDYYFGCNF